MAQISAFISATNSAASQVAELSIVKGSPLAGRFVIIDGSNAMWRGGVPRLANVLTLALEVARNARDFGIIFDANTRHVLRNARRFLDAEAYVYLLGAHRNYFVEVTGRTQADQLILAEADARSAMVVSNDLFHPYASRFRWTTDDNRVLRVNGFREDLHFAGQILPVRRNLRELVADLESAI